VRIHLGGLMVLSVSLAGCASSPRGWESPEPAARLAAVTEAGRTSDRSAIPHLIESLCHDDPVVRLAAIRTLEQLTGQT
jgi:HEAT repeat protein